VLIVKIDALTASDARKILKALGTGSAPAEYARFLLVGQKRWLDMALQLMAENAEDRDFEIRFVRARYGGGKTHFLYCMQQEAGEKGWVTSFVLLKRDLVELDRFSSFVREVARGVSLPDGARGLSSLIEQAFAIHSGRYGMTPGKTVSLMTHEQAKRGIEAYCSHNYLAAPFQTALCAAYKAHLQGDQPQVDRLLQWFGGSDSTATIEERHSPGGTAIKLKAIGPNLAEEHLRIIALLCQLGGHSGLFIGVDELELIGRLPRQRKVNSFQALRALVDQNNAHLQPPATCLFLAATPEMFEDPDKFPSYKALQDRIESLPNFSGGNTINYRGTVIDLDRTALEKSDLRSLADTLVKLHQLAFGQLADDINTKLERVLTQIANGNYLMARPRLLCRCVTDLLNGRLDADLAVAISRRAQELQEGREKELSGR
jgi:hypothetical protein